MTADTATISGTPLDIAWTLVDGLLVGLPASQVRDIRRETHPDAATQATPGERDAVRCDLSALWRRPYRGSSERWLIELDTDPTCCLTVGSIVRIITEDRAALSELPQYVGASARTAGVVGLVERGDGYGLLLDAELLARLANTGEGSPTAQEGESS